MVIVTDPVLDFEHLFSAARPIAAVHRIAEENGLDEARGVRIRISGNPALNYEEMKGILWDVGLGGVICFFFVVFVLWRALHSMKLVIAAIVTLLVGLLWTGAVAAATVGTLNLISVSLAILFIGLGVDFAIHLGMNYADALRAHAGEPDAHDRALDDLAKKIDLGSGSVFRRELNVVAILPRPPDSGHGAGDDLFFVHPQLEFAMDGAGGQEYVDPSVGGAFEGLPSSIDVLFVTTRQAANRRTADGVGNFAYGLKIAGRRNREPGFNHVHAQIDQSVRHLELFAQIHAATRRLLAVAKRRVEDYDLPGLRTSHGGVPTFGLVKCDGWSPRAFPPRRKQVIVGGARSCKKTKKP